MHKLFDIWNIIIIAISRSSFAHTRFAWGIYRLIDDVLYCVLLNFSQRFADYDYGSKIAFNVSQWQINVFNV